MSEPTPAEPLCDHKSPTGDGRAGCERPPGHDGDHAALLLGGQTFTWSATPAEPLPWRVGSHYGIHVYEGDRPVATFHRAEDAAEVVRLRNAGITAEPTPAEPLDGRIAIDRAGVVWTKRIPDESESRHPLTFYVPEAEVVRLREALRQIEALHHQPGQSSLRPWCARDQEAWPCATRRILDTVKET